MRPNEPLSLALSPLRGARELADRMVVMSKCALWRHPNVSWLDFGGRRRQTAGCNANDSLRVEYG